MSAHLGIAIGDVIAEARKVNLTVAAHVPGLMQAIERLRIAARAVTATYQPVSQPDPVNTYVPTQAPEFYATSTQSMAPEQTDPDPFRSGGGGDPGGAGASGSWESSASCSSTESSSSSSSSDSSPCSSD